MFKVCIIGTGMIVNSAHIPAYKTFPNDFEIVAVSDINEKSAKDTATKFGIKNYYVNAQEMLDTEKPDLVSICVPNCFHKQYAMMALNAGANVLCEKPLAFTKADAIEMFDLAKQKGKVLMACQTMRFTPDRISAKKYIENGNLGVPYYCEVARIRRRGIPFWGSFHIEKISKGGAFVDIGVHMIDALIYLTGNSKVKSVKAVTMQNHKNELGSLKGSGAFTGNVDNAKVFNPDDMDVEDFSSGYITFENGMQVSVRIAWASNMAEQNDIKIIGTKTGMYLPEGKIYYGENGEDTLTPVKEKYNVQFSGHYHVIENFLKVLKGESEPIVKPEETIAVSKILEMFYKSAKSGKEVYDEEN